MGSLALTLAWALLPVFVALPAVAAWRRRRASREASAVAADLVAYAAAVRAANRMLPLGDALRARVHRLKLPDAAPMQLAGELERGGPETMADAAQRLALRLRRRVAFDRKMLARSASGLRRGAIAAALPPALLWLLLGAGIHVPPGTQGALILVEVVGCALLWRVARVGV